MDHLLAMKLAKLTMMGSTRIYQLLLMFTYNDVTMLLLDSQKLISTGVQSLTRISERTFWCTSKVQRMRGESYKKRIQNTMQVWGVRARHLVPGLPSQYIFFLRCCYLPDCPHPVCQDGKPDNLLHWYPGGPTTDFLPLPVPDSSRSWGDSNWPAHMSMFANNALLGGGVRVRVWIREQRKIKRRSKALLSLWWQTWTSLQYIWRSLSLAAAERSVWIRNFKKSAAQLVKCQFAVVGRQLTYLDA